MLFSGFLTRTVYFCKLELAEIHGSTVCLCTCAFVVCILSASARVHVSLMGLQAGPGLRLYACKLRRWCAGAFRSGPGKTHNPKGICFGGNKQRETKGNKRKQRETPGKQMKTKGKQRETKGNEGKQKETQGNKRKHRDKMCWHCRWHKVPQALTQDWA